MTANEAIKALKTYFDHREGANKVLDAMEVLRTEITNAKAMRAALAAIGKNMCGSEPLAAAYALDMLGELR